MSTVHPLTSVIVNNIMHLNELFLFHSILNKNPKSLFIKRNLFLFHTILQGDFLYGVNYRLVKLGFAFGVRFKFEYLLVDFERDLNRVVTYFSVVFIFSLTLMF